MSKADAFRQRAEELQRKLHSAVDDIKQLRSTIKSHDELESKRRSTCRNADEGLLGIERSLNNPLFEIDRLVAGHFAAIRDEDLKD